MSISMKEKIEQKLRESLDPISLEVINESHLHQGHAGDDGTGESHFKLKIVSPKFKGLNRVGRHKIVYQTLGDIMKEIHALSLDLKDCE